MIKTRPFRPATWRNPAKDAHKSKVDTVAHETQRLAEFAASLRYEDVPADVVERARNTIIDTAGTIVFGYDLPWSQMIVAQARRSGPGGRSRILGLGGPLVQAPAAAFANGALAHAYELDNLTDRRAGVPSIMSWMREDFDQIDQVAQAMVGRLHRGGKRLARRRVDAENTQEVGVVPANPDAETADPQDVETGCFEQSCRLLEPRLIRPVVALCGRSHANRRRNQHAASSKIVHRIGVPVSEVVRGTRSCAPRNRGPRPA